jgi:hypothetical protein
MIYPKVSFKKVKFAIPTNPVIANRINGLISARVIAPIIMGLALDAIVPNAIIIPPPIDRTLVGRI